jgi:hypothetical protein
MAQVWLLTGSSRGLGRAIVEAGLAAGNKVLATARDVESLHDLSERHADQIKLFALDVTDEFAAASAAKAAIGAFGSLEVVMGWAAPIRSQIAALLLQLLVTGFPAKARMLNGRCRPHGASNSMKRCILWQQKVWQGPSRRPPIVELVSFKWFPTNFQQSFQLWIIYGLHKNANQKPIGKCGQRRDGGA